MCLILLNIRDSIVIEKENVIALVELTFNVENIYATKITTYRKNLKR